MYVPLSHRVWALVVMHGPMYLLVRRFSLDLAGSKPRPSFPARVHTNLLNTISLPPPPPPSFSPLSLLPWHPSWSVAGHNGSALLRPRA